MKMVLLSGSNVGTKTRTVIDRLAEAVASYDPTIELSVIDLAEADMEFADGRNFTEYTGDTGRVARELMGADAIIIGTRSSSFDPGGAEERLRSAADECFLDKVAGVIATAGSSKHYLIPAQHLLPILSYMKAQVVQPYVFVGESDLHRGEIVSHDVLQRLDRLVEDTIVLTRTFASIREERDAAYGF